MPECKFVTVLTRVCGRPATHTVRWLPAPGPGVVLPPAWEELLVCPFHHEIQLVDLSLDCEVLDWAASDLTPQEVA